MEMDELQRRITELCDINADLQVPPQSLHYHFLYLALRYNLLLLWHSVALLFSLPVSLPWMFEAIPPFLPSSNNDPSIVGICLGHNYKPLFTVLSLYCTFFVFFLCNHPLPVHRCKFTLLMLFLAKRKLWFKRSVPHVALLFVFMFL